MKVDMKVLKYQNVFLFLAVNSKSRDSIVFSIGVCAYFLAVSNVCKESNCLDWCYNYLVNQGGQIEKPVKTRLRIGRR